MSVLYSILKPIIKKAVKRNLHQETYEEFVQVSHELQAKFKFRLPGKKGYEFRDEIIDGCHCIVGHKSGSHTKRAFLPFTISPINLPFWRARYDTSSNDPFFGPLYRHDCVCWSF